MINIAGLIIYMFVFGLGFLTFLIYLQSQKRRSDHVVLKIEEAKVNGFYEPVSLHPVIDANSCIKTGACIMACPEKDILGIRNGVATTINASHCIGHGACFHACPVDAISLCIGTEKRGVELPHINQNFETNIPGIFIAGEMGGMGLIKNGVEQGKQAVENIVKTLPANRIGTYDLIIVGAGPAGISASLAAKKFKLKTLTLEQDTLGGTVFSFPRAKVVMTAPMDLPLFGKVKLYETSKQELLDLWSTVLSENDISIQENSKVEEIIQGEDHFNVILKSGETYSTDRILLAIGRRGSPKKLNVPGETLPKVAYRLLEPERIRGEDILVVGGGDSAVESAMLLENSNRVTLSYRGESFKRLKPKNLNRIRCSMEEQRLKVLFSSNLTSIDQKYVTISQGSGILQLENDRVFIFAGGELPTQFLEKAGIKITKKFGYALLRH